jgi:hypothetical protein
MKGGRGNGRGCPADCKALCCKYIIRKIGTPRDKHDFDELYWYLCHEKVAVYVERRRWYLLVEVPCQHLNRRSLQCRIYPLRPNVCRLHSEHECEYTGKVGFDEFMLTPEDLVKHLKRRGVPIRVPWLPKTNGRGSTPVTRPLRRCLAQRAAASVPLRRD